MRKQIALTTTTTTKPRTTVRRKRIYMTTTVLKKEFISVVWWNYETTIFIKYPCIRQWICYNFKKYTTAHHNIIKYHIYSFRIICSPFWFENITIKTLKQNCNCRLVAGLLHSYYNQIYDAKHEKSKLV